MTDSALLGLAMLCGVGALLVTRQAIPAMYRLAAGAGQPTHPETDRLVAAARLRAPLLLLVFTCLFASLVRG